LISSNETEVLLLSTIGNTQLTEPRTSVQARDVELVFRQGGPPPPSSDQVIHVHKPPAFIAKIDALLQPVAPRRMAEVGVFHGGSTIYWQWQYDLDLLIAFEKEPTAPPLTNYLHRNGLSDRVRVHFGVSQDDTARMRAALLHDLGGELLDVVNDDASHQYAETRSTVETLLPFVRRRGLYHRGLGVGPSQHLAAGGVGRCAADVAVVVGADAGLRARHRRHREDGNQPVFRNAVAGRSGASA
jgi:hypothetical protein